MLRTRLLLVLLTLLAGFLLVVKIMYRPADSSNQSQNILPSGIPLPSITPSLPSPTPIPLPTLNTFETTKKTFAVSFPFDWTLAAVATGSAAESWQLNIKTASASATMKFSVKQSNLLPSLTCPENNNECQVTSINNHDYQILLGTVTAAGFTINYKSVNDPYVLEIKGTFTGSETELTELVSSWDVISQTFRWL